MEVEKGPWQRDPGCEGFYTMFPVRCRERQGSAILSVAARGRLHMNTFCVEMNAYLFLAFMLTHMVGM